MRAGKTGSQHPNGLPIPGADNFGEFESALASDFAVGTDHSTNLLRKTHTKKLMITDKEKTRHLKWAVRLRENSELQG